MELLQLTPPAVERIPSDAHVEAARLVLAEMQGLTRSSQIGCVAQAICNAEQRGAESSPQAAGDGQGEAEWAIDCLDAWRDLGSRHGVRRVWSMGERGICVLSEFDRFTGERLTQREFDGNWPSKYPSRVAAARVLAGADPTLPQFSGGKAK